jgi:hypothetical protein
MPLSDHLAGLENIHGVSGVEQLRVYVLDQYVVYCQRFRIGRGSTLFGDDEWNTAS